MMYVLEKNDYGQHEWLICFDLKMVILLSGFTKYPWFWRMWDSRDRAQQYTKNVWHVRQKLLLYKPTKLINNPLVDRDNILSPHLHTKLGRIKQFTKALDNDGGLFTYLRHSYSGLTMEKL